MFGFPFLPGASLPSKTLVKSSDLGFVEGARSSDGSVARRIATVVQLPDPGVWLGRVVLNH
jgi:hypothetical protein